MIIRTYTGGLCGTDARNCQFVVHAFLYFAATLVACGFHGLQVVCAVVGPTVCSKRTEPLVDGLMAGEAHEEVMLFAIF